MKPLLVDNPTKRTSRSCKWPAYLLYVLIILLLVVIYILVSYSLDFWPFKEDSSTQIKRYPNVIFILMDDLGYTDNSYYSSLSKQRNNNVSFAMKNWEDIWQNSIRLNYHYTESACSPTRSALLTGMYPWKTGIVSPIIPGSNAHPNTNFTFLVNYLVNNKVNYDPALIGKWHQGCATKEYLPFYRGFTNENNLFFTSGHIDFMMKNICIPFQMYDMAAMMEGSPVNGNITSTRNELFGELFCSFDFYNNTGQIYELQNDNSYIESLFANNVLQIINNSKSNSQPYFIYYSMPTPHFPVTTPPLYDLQNEIIDYSNCDSIISDDNNSRIKFCKMMNYVDAVLGNILDNINLNETILILTSDNGASYNQDHAMPGTELSGGQSLPLRGSKQTPFEGGIRTGAAIYGGWDFLKNKLDCDYNNLMYVADWMPTIFDMIGVDVDNNELEIDGISLWDDIESVCID
eukprot:161556_1